MDPVQEDYKRLIAHWDEAFRMTDEDREPVPEEAIDNYRELAPSAKLADAAASFAGCENALDYGSGSGWAGVIMARSGCKSVTCADAAPSAREAASFLAEQFRCAERVRPILIDEEWLANVPEGGFDGPGTEGGDGNAGHKVGKSFHGLSFR